MNVYFFILYLLVIFILVDIYFRLKHREVLAQIIVANNQYEKILLMKKLINKDDIASTRNTIKERLSEREYERIRDIFLEVDDDYVESMSELATIDSKHFNKNSNIIKELIYQGDYIKAASHLSEINRTRLK